MQTSTTELFILAGHATGMSVPTPKELRATLVTVVAGGTETPPGKWEKLIGDFEMLSLAGFPSVMQLARGRERECRGPPGAGRAIELLQREHPHGTREESPGG